MKVKGESDNLRQEISGQQPFDNLLVLRVPKGMPIRQRVLRREPHVYEWTYERTHATIKYLEKNTQVEWIGYNIPAFHAYRFDW